jgi:hypothetical protein
MIASLLVIAATGIGAQQLLSRTRGIDIPDGWAAHRSRIGGWVIWHPAGWRVRSSDADADISRPDTAQGDPSIVEIRYEFQRPYDETGAITNPEIPEELRAEKGHLHGRRYYANRLGDRAQYVIEWTPSDSMIVTIRPDNAINRSVVRTLSWVHSVDPIAFWDEDENEVARYTWRNPFNAGRHWKDHPDGLLGRERTFPIEDVRSSTEAEARFYVEARLDEALWDRPDSCYTPNEKCLIEPTRETRQTIGGKHVQRTEFKQDAAQYVRYRIDWLLVTNGRCSPCRTLEVTVFAATDAAWRRFGPDAERAISSLRAIDR